MHIKQAFRTVHITTNHQLKCRLSTKETVQVVGNRSFGSVPVSYLHTPHFQLNTPPPSQGQQNAAG